MEHQPDPGPLAEASLSARGTQVVCLSADDVVAKRGIAEVRLRFPDAAALVNRVLGLADGTTTAEQIIGAFDADGRDGARQIVTGLRARGLLRDEAVADDPAATFWSSMAAYAPNAPERLSQARVRVSGDSRLTDLICGALRSTGVGQVDSIDVDSSEPEGAGPASADTTLWCAAAIGDPDPQLTAPAHVALRSGVPFLPVWLNEMVVRIGPLTYPYDTACLRCFLLRTDSNDDQLDIHRQLRRESPQSDDGAGYLPPMLAVAAQIAATEGIKHLSGLPVTTAGRVIELSLVPYRSSVRRVLRVPRCPECSGAARQGSPVVAHGSQLAQ